jgi:hypothetical protein
MDATQPNQLELDRSIFGTIYRRTHFFLQYIYARVRSRTVARLLPIVEKSFDHPWVAEVDLRIRFWPGRERVWLWFKNPERAMTWDAPITVSVFRKRRGKKKLALCFSIYLVGDTLNIKQIQGLPRTDVPNELREWPKVFMEACRTFARQEILKGVRVPRADSLYSYHTPTLNPELLPDSRERALEQIRKNMRLLYDANALALGFVSDGVWFKWLNPNSAQLPRHLVTWSWTGLALLGPSLKLIANVGRICDNFECETICTLCASGVTLC